MKTLLTALLVIAAVTTFMVLRRWHQGKSFNLPKKLNWWWLGGVLAIVLIGATIWWWQSRPEKPKGGTTTDSTTTAAQYYAPPQVQEPSLRNWDKIPPEGIKVCLLRGWHTFPLGGGIKITDPDGGEIFDKPGERVKVGWRSEGWYTIHADPLGSERGVQILARWCF